MAIDLTQIEELGVTPIPGDAPGGQNIQDSDDYDQVLRMFQWLTSLERGSQAGAQEIGGGEQPTWVSLAENSCRILREKSKNLQVATYLIIAICQEEGIPGLAAGLKLIDGLLKNFWETMFPPLKLVKGRMSALEFMSTTIAGDSAAPGGMIAAKGQSILDNWRKLLEQNPSQSERDANYEELEVTLGSIDSSMKSMETIREKVYALFPQDKLPNITSLSAAMKDMHLYFAEEVKKHKKVEAPPPTAQPATAAGPTTTQITPSVSTSAPIPTSTDPTEARKAMVKMAPLLREADPSDPASYRLVRMGIFGTISQLPPIKEGKVTRVPPGAVTKPLMDSVAALMQSSNWINLLNQTEGRFPNAPLWLDQQYHTYRALKGMGPSFDTAARAVMDELANLVRKLPGLVELSFDGGVPFADDMTRRWIDTDVLAASGGGGGGSNMPAVSSSGGNGASSELEEAINQAGGLAREGKLAEAIALLQPGSRTASSFRERYLWRMALARIVQEAGKPRLTQPIWESLLDDIERYQLESWEPWLCVPVLHALYQLCKNDKAQAEKAEQVFSRLCRVDPRAALGLEK